MPEALSRRRGRNWNRVKLGLGGLAAALGLLLAYRTEWNPLPALAVVGLVVVLLKLPYRSIAEGLLMASIPDPLAYIRQQTGTRDDVMMELHQTYLLGGARGAEAGRQLDRLVKLADEVRPLYFAIDGSERRPDFQKDFRTMQMPLWWRIMFLPELVGLNYGVRRWSFDGAMFGKDGAYESVFLKYSSMNTAPELARWLRAAPLIRELLGQDVYFGTGGYTTEDNVRYWGVNMMFRPWMEGHKPGQFTRWIPDSELAIIGEPDPVEEVSANPLPYEPLPFIQEQFPLGHLKDGWLYFGEQFLDKEQAGHWLKIDEMTHFLVMGTSGFGKSVFLNQILQGVKYNLHRYEKVVLVDLKGGVELAEYLDYGSEFQLCSDFIELMPLLEEVVAVMTARLAEMRANRVKNWPGKRYLFVIDEYAQIQLSDEGTKEERASKQRMLQMLNRISTLGRAAGITIWAQLQKGTSDVMDSSFRANLASQVCFKVPNKLTAAGMFGSTDELMVDPVKLPKGRFILYDASRGETHYLQARVQP